MLVRTRCPVRLRTRYPQSFSSPSYRTGTTSTSSPVPLKLTVTQCSFSTNWSRLMLVFAS